MAVEEASQEFSGDEDDWPEEGQAAASIDPEEAQAEYSVEGRPSKRGWSPVGKEAWEQTSTGAEYVVGIREPWLRRRTPRYLHSNVVIEHLWV